MLSKVLDHTLRDKLLPSEVKDLKRRIGINTATNTPNRVIKAIEARLQESTATDLNLDAFLASLSLDDSGNLLTRTLRRAFAETEPEDPGDHAGTTTIGAYL